MGNGTFILPINAALRRALKKRKGSFVEIFLAHDASEIELSKNLRECLNDESSALTFFKSLPPSHQRYFSKWIESAKTIETKSKRIAAAVNALSAKKGFGEMLREMKNKG